MELLECVHDPVDRGGPDVGLRFFMRPPSGIGTTPGVILHPAWVRLSAKRDDGWGTMFWREDTECAGGLEC